MNNPNLDDTLPNPVHQESDPEPPPSTIPPEGTPGSDDETRPVMINAENPSLQDTEPVPAQPSGDSGQGMVEPPAPPESAGGVSWKFLAAVGIITLLIIALISAYGGYRAGLFQREMASATQVSQQVQDQFALAMQDVDSKNYEVARQRLEWVIQQDPGYPGVVDKLAEVQIAMSITASPTPVPTPTLTPTPDLRSVEELFAQAKQSMDGADWSTAIDTLLKLRKEASGYRTIDVDGMLYSALRNRGVEKIKKTDLEGGTYDLALAEKFGPLDGEANNWREWAEFYITGASFWDVDWAQVINYFSQLAPIVPNLADGSGWTATERLRMAYLHYGDQLAQSGDWCKAQKQYEAAQEMSGTGPEIKATASQAEEKCAAGTEKKSKKTPTEAPGEVATQGVPQTPQPPAEPSPTTQYP